MAVVGSLRVETQRHKFKPHTIQNYIYIMNNIDVQ